MTVLPRRFFPILPLVGMFVLDTSCAETVRVDPSLVPEGDAQVSDAGADPSLDAGDAPTPGADAATGRWVLVAVSTGACDFEWVAEGRVVADVPPEGACPPCPTPTDSPGDYEGAVCSSPVYPRCIYHDGTARYLDCRATDAGSPRFVSTFDL